MRRTFYLLLGVMILTSVGCGVTGSSATPTPRGTSIQSPTPTPLATATFAAPIATPTLIPSPTPTPSPSAPDALSVLRAAEENLRAETTFHVTVLQEDSDGPSVTEIDVLRPDRVRLVTDFSAGEGMAEGELITVGASQFILYPGFQGWFALGETPIGHLTDLGGFPYDLGGLMGAVQEPEMVGEEILEGKAAHHLTGVFPVEFREAIGFPSGVDAPTMDMWVGAGDLLPLRIESRVEGPSTGLLFTYSDYGARMDIGVPDDVIIDAGYLDRLANGDLNPEEIGQLVRIFPVPGQECIEETVGTGLYSMMIGGDIGNNLLVWNAFRACAHRIFPFSFESVGAEGEP